MKRVLGAITCGVWMIGWIGCVAIAQGVTADEEPETPKTPTSEVSAADVETGATLNREHKCSRCHGDEGRGDGPVFVKKGERISDWTQHIALADVDDAYLAEIIVKGGKALGKSPKMMKYGRKLNEEQVGALVTFIRALAPAEAEERAIPDPTPAAEEEESAIPDLTQPAVETATQ